jgi:hypothetical protein
MDSKLRQFGLSGFVAGVVAFLAYRKTHIPRATTGHKHRFFSFYLTKGLNLRGESGETIQAVDLRNLTLWIVPPGMFHEWVVQKEAGIVWDMTPLHRPHLLSVGNG